MQFKVDARELVNALSVLKTVTRSPRIVASDLLNCVLIRTIQQQMQLTATNLTTQLTMVIGKSPSPIDESGCVDLVDLLRFAQNVSAGDSVLAVKTSHTVLMLTNDSHTQRTYIPIYAAVAFPRQREVAQDVICQEVPVGRMLSVLERVSIDGTNRSPSAMNEVLVELDREAGLNFAFADAHRVVHDTLHLEMPVAALKRLVLDGCSVQPLLLQLRAVRASIATWSLGLHTLRIDYGKAGSALVLLRQVVDRPPSLPVLVPGAHDRLLWDVDPEPFAHAVRCAMDGDTGNWVWLVTSPYSEATLSDEGGNHCASVLGGFGSHGMRVGAPAFTLLDLCHLAREERLWMYADINKGPMQWRIGRVDENPSFTYCVTSTRWGQR